MPHIFKQNPNIIGHLISTSGSALTLIWLLVLGLLVVTGGFERLIGIIGWSAVPILIIPLILFLMSVYLNKAAKPKVIIANDQKIIFRFKGKEESKGWDEVVKITKESFNNVHSYRFEFKDKKWAVLYNIDDKSLYSPTDKSQLSIFIDRKIKEIEEANVTIV